LEGEPASNIPGYYVAGATGLAKSWICIRTRCQPIWPVAEVLVARGLPFVFATGYGQRGVPEPYRGTPTLGKPFDADALEQAIKAVL